jgi:DNA-binding NarL/FixJ family response regulator
MVSASAALRNDPRDAELPGFGMIARKPDLASRLSPTQQTIAAMLLSGLSQPEIAKRIGRSPHTVHDHTKAIYTRLGVSSRVALVLRFSGAN